MRSIAKEKVTFGVIIGVLLMCAILGGVKVLAAAAAPGTPPQETTGRYAVVVVGANQNDWEMMHLSFGNTGDRVYSILKAKGFTDENIRYLSWDDQNSNVDALSTKYNIQMSLIWWLPTKLNNGQDVEKVVIYFIDHGDVDGIGYYFAPYDNPQNLVYDYELSSWINSALTESDGSKNYRSATIVFETCYSGLLLDPFWNIIGPDRIVISSTDSFKQAYSWWKEWYMWRPPDSDGETIFSYYFMKNIESGLPVEQAFNVACFQTINEVNQLAQKTGTGEVQSPQMDDQYPNLLYW